MATPTPIVDSHIHLWPASEVRSLRWNKPGNPLDGQQSVEQYRTATEPLGETLRGFIFIEADRKSYVGEEIGWTDPFREVDYIRRVVDGKPRKGEGHAPADGELCLAAIFWAPIPSGPEVICRYVERLKERAGPELFQRAKGFRYLVQDKPRGTMLDLDFIQSLRWLGRHGFTFDLGLDQRSGGLWQLDEAIEMLSLVNQGVDENRMVKVIINHMAKPNMKRVKSNSANYTEDDAEASFVEWRDRISYLASFPNTYMKLSGAFSEIDRLPSESVQKSLDFWERQRLLNEVTEHINPWVRHCLESFGSSRCMFGSNWPVDNVGGGGNSTAWLNWFSIVKVFCSGLPPDEAHMVWEGTANRVYQLGI